MRTAAILAVATLALSAMLWAADDAVVTPQEAASYQAGGITIPPVLSYQGRLTDATGVPLPDGQYSTTFKLYTQPSGGSPFWMETQKASTRDGLFSVLLGSVTPISIGARGQGLGVREPETGDEGLGTRSLSENRA